MAENTPLKQLPPGVEFRINDDGSVTFINVPEELMDLVHALNPDAMPTCELPKRDVDKVAKDQRDTNEHPRE